MAEQPWWKRGLAWVKQQRETPAPAAQLKSPSGAARFELVPGQLSAHVYDHLLPTAHGMIPCWSYVTTGLERHQQPEIVFTLAHAAEATAAPEEPLRLFQQIDQLAQSGQLVNVGGVTQFGERKFLGRHLAYIPAEKLSGVTLPPSAICAILVTDDEVAAIQEFGLTRVMARLGQAARYYPCPPWSDPSRPGISFAQARQQSLLGQVARLYEPGCRVYQADGQVVLLLAQGSGSRLASQLAELPQDVAFALVTELDPDADGCFVWEPGQSGPAAITPEGSTGKRLCGCFLGFAVGQEEDRVFGVEDGFVVSVTPQTWRAILESIGQEKRKHIPPTGEGMPFVIDWDSEVFENPVDGKSYVAPGGWRQYRPQSPADGTRKKVAIEQIRLLTAQDEAEARVTVEDLAQFTKSVHRQAETFFEKSATAFELMVQFNCKPSGHEVQMAHQGEADQELLQKLYDSLTAMEKLGVKADDVAFQIHFKVSP